MNPAIGNGDHAGDAGARLFGQGLGQRGHQLRAGIALAIADRHAAQFGILASFDGAGQRLHRLVGLRPAVLESLAGGAVIDHHHDIGERCAVLLLIDGARKRGEDHQTGDPAQRPARQATPERERTEDRDTGGKHRQNRPREQRREEDGADHCPSLSRSAGTWTWSDL